MRPIKFRAFVQNHVWEVNAISFNEAGDITNVYLCRTIQNQHVVLEALPWRLEYQLLQFTGLLDKNGKEIYEGYLINGHGFGLDPLPVVYSFASFGVLKGDTVLVLDPRTHNVEVMGDIYTTPELLTQTK